MKSTVPFIPEWVYLRPTIAKHMQLASDGLGLSKGEQGRRDDKKLLSSFSLQAQEWYLIEDILDIMLGFEGVYIKKRGEGRSLNFVIEPYLESASCDPSLYQLCQKIFVLPLNYLIVENYIALNNIENGTVCQALTGALRTLLK
jgi:gamma-tubulin complex component 2